MDHKHSFYVANKGTVQNATTPIAILFADGLYVFPVSRLTLLK